MENGGWGTAGTANGHEVSRLSPGRAGIVRRPPQVVQQSFRLLRPPPGVMLPVAAQVGHGTSMSGMAQPQVSRGCTEPSG
ncbi:hypothetical protein NS229_14795 [Methylobacterium indicum]|nr:hypothetical protein NS229_14795 [Methylobacterium indicum]